MDQVPESVYIRPGSGCLRATFARDDRAMVVMAKRRWLDPALTLNRDFAMVANVCLFRTIDTDTMRLIYVLAGQLYVCHSLQDIV